MGAMPRPASAADDPAWPRPAADRHESLGDKAAAHIKRLIFDGVLAPGTRVPQDLVAQELGISRVPVREALIGLEREGWVRIELHRGAFVHGFDEATLRDHYELYGLVLGFAARRALERVDADALAAKLTTLAKQVAKAKEPALLGELTVDFHDTVLRASTSRPSAKLLRALSQMVPGDFFSLVPHAMVVERRGLPKIAAAIAARDGEAADAEYRRVMHAVGDDVLAVFAARGLLTEPQERASAG